jgi:hypothetical protein
MDSLIWALCGTAGVTVGVLAGLVFMALYPRRATSQLRQR